MVRPVIASLAIMGATVGLGACADNSLSSAPGGGPVTQSYDLDQSKDYLFDLNYPFAECNGGNNPLSVGEYSGKNDVAKMTKCQQDLEGATFTIHANISTAVDTSPTVAHRYGDGAALIAFVRANVKGYMIAVCPGTVPCSSFAPGDAVYIAMKQKTVSFADTGNSAPLLFVESIAKQ